MNVFIALKGSHFWFFIPILNKWVVYFGPTLYDLKYGVTWLKNLTGVKIGNKGLYIFIFICISEIDW